MASQTTNSFRCCKRTQLSILKKNLIRASNKGWQSSLRISLVFHSLVVEKFSNAFSTWRLASLLFNTRHQLPLKLVASMQQLWMRLNKHRKKIIILLVIDALLKVCHPNLREWHFKAISRNLKHQTDLPHLSTINNLGLQINSLPLTLMTLESLCQMMKPLLRT